MTAQNTNNNRIRLRPYLIAYTTGTKLTVAGIDLIKVAETKDQSRYEQSHSIPFQISLPLSCLLPSLSVLSMNEGGREGSCEGKTIEMDQIFPSVLGIEEQERGDLRHWRCLNLQSGLLQIWNSYHSAMCSAQLVL